MSDTVARKCFTGGELEQICKILADTSFGLTGSEIAQFLRVVGVEDIGPHNTKWRRLFNALANAQNSRKTGNIVLAFIAKALQPARYIDNTALYRSTLERLNMILSFHGLEFQDDGEFHTVRKVSTLTEAERRASKLREELLNRNLHKDLLAHCRAELLQENYFHAVLEATKSIAARIRRETGLTSDGAALIDETFSGSAPLLRINSYVTETDKGEQRGFVNLAKGLFGTFRNPTAHAPKIEWDLPEEDALDLFTLASYVLRRIDRAVPGTKKYAL